MLLALRRIVDADLPIPIRIGVNRGAIFAGDIGPFYRRTYTVMGDAVNLAARLMAKAEPGHIYATADVLDRSNTLFATDGAPPFVVKGKAKPVEAWEVGRAEGSRPRQASLQELAAHRPRSELAVVAGRPRRCARGQRAAVRRRGRGGHRQVAARRRAARGSHGLPHPARRVRGVHGIDAVCGVAGTLARAAGLRPRRSRRGVAARCASRRRRRRISMPWLPLIAIAFGVDVPPTPEVDMLAEKNRRPKLHETVASSCSAAARPDAGRDRKRAPHGRRLRRAARAPRAHRAAAIRGSFASRAAVGARIQRARTPAAVTASTCAARR